MLATILTILKIIGIVLLVLIGVILVLILLVLFWPFFYRIYGDNRTKINGGVKISWLLHFISVKAYYADAFNIEARVLGIKVYDKLRKEAKELAKAEKASHKKNDISENHNESEYKKAKNKKSDIKEALNTEALNTEASNKEAEEYKSEECNINVDNTDYIDPEISDDFDWDDLPSDNGKVWFKKKNKKTKDKKEKRNKSKSLNNIKKKFTGKKVISFTDWLANIFDKIWDFIDDLPWKMQEFAEKPEKKIDDLVDTICYYDRILSSNGTEWVVEYIKKKVFAILKAIKPSKSVINIDYASTDPEKAAKAFEAFVMTRPLHPKSTNMNVAFDHDDMKFDARVKGSFLLAPIVYHGLTLVFNKKVKKFIKLMKREDS